MRTFIISTAIVIMVFILSNCSQQKSADDTAVSTELPDTLRVGTLYSPTSFFLYRGDSLGYDYELVKRLAQDKGMTPDLLT